jgi:hypothetical protein
MFRSSNRFFEGKIMFKNRFIFTAGLLVMGTVAAHATWYTNEASFMAAISATNYIEDFSNFTFGSPLNGSQATWVAPGANGYGYTASAVLGLYSNTSSLSTNNANDPLILTFTGSPVSAFGGRISNTNISGGFISGTCSITLNTSETSSISLGAAEGFLGWVGPSSFTSVTLLATSSVANNWIQLDHSIVGAAPVPEPASMAVLGMGALAAIARRRRK